MISVLPPQYLDWAKDIKIEGKSDLFFTLKGMFSEPLNIKARFTARLPVKDGRQIPVPMNNLNEELNIDLPSLDAKQLNLDLKTLSFDLRKNNNFRAWLKPRD